MHFSSAEKEKTPDRLEKSPMKAEANTNGSNGSAGRKERWDGSRGSSSTMDHLMKGSHRGYGGQGDNFIIINPNCFHFINSGIKVFLMTKKLFFFLSVPVS